jgi:hypothetical protein
VLHLAAPLLDAQAFQVRLEAWLAARLAARLAVSLEAFAMGWH